MTDLDDPALWTPITEPTPTGARPRPHRHDWCRHMQVGSTTEGDPVCFQCGTVLLSIVPTCVRCGAVRDESKSRTGRQSRNYGNRAELDAARRYGGTKTGHAGGPTDVRGTTRKLQVKSTRRAVPAMWRSAFAKLDSERDGRLALLLLRFIRPGNLGPDDYFVVRGRDLLEWLGKDGET